MRLKYKSQYIYMNKQIRNLIYLKMQTWTTCSLSGEQIESPVISKVSGHLFEKRLIEKHIEATGTCPITGRPLSCDDLIPVKVSAIQKPRPVAATSVPSLIQLLQNEWDSLLLEQFQLKQHLEKVRHELTHALYQHDAACRVIARVIKERDQARMELAQLQERVQNNRMQAETSAERLPETVQRDIEDMALKLNNMRKQRRKQPEFLLKFPTKETLQNFQTKRQFNIGATVCLDVQQDYYLFGSADGTVILQDAKEVTRHSPIPPEQDRPERPCQESHLRQLPLHRRKRTLHHHLPRRIHLRLCTGARPVEEILRVQGDVGSEGVRFAPDPIPGSERGEGWSVRDARCLREFEGETADEGEGLRGGERVHVSGHPPRRTLHGAGAEGRPDQDLEVQHARADHPARGLEVQGQVTQLHFSENGIQLASRADTEVNIWSLKTSEIVQKLFEGKSIGAIQFDHSGQYLAISEQGNINLLETKSWQTFQKLQVHKDAINGIRFGQFSKSLVTCSLDQNVNVTS